MIDVLDQTSSDVSEFIPRPTSFTVFKKRLGISVGMRC